MRAYLRLWAGPQAVVGRAAIIAVHAVAAALAVYVAKVNHLVPVHTKGFALVNAFAYVAISEGLLRANLGGASLAPLTSVVSAGRWIETFVAGRVSDAAERNVTVYKRRLPTDHALVEATRLLQIVYGTNPDGFGPAHNLASNKLVLEDATGSDTNRATALNSVRGDVGRLTTQSRDVLEYPGERLEVVLRRLSSDPIHRTVFERIFRRRS